MVADRVQWWRTEYSGGPSTRPSTVADRVQDRVQWRTEYNEYKYNEYNEYKYNEYNEYKYNEYNLVPVTTLQARRLACSRRQPLLNLASNPLLNVDVFYLDGRPDFPKA